MKVVALFKLRAGRSVGDYRELSLDVIRRGMFAMPPESLG